jgi:hypothetical protein
MSNLPSSVRALTPPSRHWAIRRTWEIIQMKIDADRIDAETGQGMQDNMEFLIEIHLMRAEKR